MGPSCGYTTSHTDPLYAEDADGLVYELNARWLGGTAYVPYQVLSDTCKPCLATDTAVCPAAGPEGSMKVPHLYLPPFRYGWDSEEPQLYGSKIGGGRPASSDAEKPFTYPSPA